MHFMQWQYVQDIQQRGVGEVAYCFLAPQWTVSFQLQWDLFLSRGNQLLKNSNQQLLVSYVYMNA